MANHLPSNTPSMAFFSESIVTKLMSALDPIFRSERQTIANRFDQLEKTVKCLSRDVEIVQEETREQTRQAVAYLERLHKQHKNATQSLMDRMDKLQSAMGKCDRDPTKSLMDRLSDIEFAIEEMLERIKDPEAVLPTIARVDARTNPLEALKVHEAVSARTPERSPILGSTVGTARHDGPIHGSAENSPKSHRPNSHGTLTVAEGGIEPEFSDSGSGSGSGPCAENPDDAVRSVKSSSVLFRPDTLVPVNWSQEASSPSMIFHNDWEPNEQMTFFQPQNTRETIASFMVQPCSPTVSPDGTIASLRRNALGRSFLNSFDEHDRPDDLSALLRSFPASRSPSPPDTSSTSFEQLVHTTANYPDVSATPSEDDDSISQEEQSVLKMISHSISGSVVSDLGSLSPLSSLYSDLEENAIRQSAVKIHPELKVTQCGEETQIPSKNTVPRKRKVKKQSTAPPAKRARRLTKKECPVGKKKSMLATSKIEWPEKSEGNDVFYKTYVQCDHCDLWYHYGCVGIVKGDVRTEPTEKFSCPPCSASTRARARKQGCARPDCHQLDNTGFLIERIVGRIADDKAGQHYRWLVKWEGYPISQATWEREDCMSHPEILFAAFSKAAEQEGFDQKSSPHIVLAEAVKGGWV